MLLFCVNRGLPIPIQYHEAHPFESAGIGNDGSAVWYPRTQDLRGWTLAASESDAMTADSEVDLRDLLQSILAELKLIRAHLSAENEPKPTKPAHNVIDRAILLIQKHDGNVAKIAKSVGVGRSTLYRSERFKKLRDGYVELAGRPPGAIPDGVVTATGPDGVEHIDWDATLASMEVRFHDP